MRGTIGFRNEFKAAVQAAPTHGKHDGELVAGFYGHTYTMLAIYKDKVELVTIYTQPEWRGNGCARKTIGLLTMLAMKNHITIEVRKIVPFDNSPLDKATLARWFFRRWLRVVGMGAIRQAAQPPTELLEVRA